MKTIGLTTTLGLLLATPVLALPGNDDAKPEAKKKKGSIKITLADGTVRTPKKGISLAASSKRSGVSVRKVERRANQVLFSVRDKDITEVLPLFEKQVGVRIRYRGPVGKKVTLRLTQPVHWEQALDLIQTFSGTHLTRDYQGRMELRHGYGGDLSEVKYEAAEEQLLRRGRRIARNKTVKASAPRVKGKIPQNQPTLWKPVRRNVPKIQIGNPRPMRMGAFNVRAPRVGPNRVGPRRVGVQFRGPRRRGPQRVGPQRVGPRRPLPSF